MIQVNLEKAKGITKDILRQKRKPLLEKLDLQFMLVLEQGGDTAAVVQEKQRLRDITNLVDGLQDLDELKEASQNLLP